MAPMCIWTPSIFRTFANQDATKLAHSTIRVASHLLQVGMAVFSGKPTSTSCPSLSSKAQSTPTLSPFEFFRARTRTKSDSRNLPDTSVSCGLRSAEVNAFDALAYGAEQVGSDGADAARDAVGEKHLVAVRAVNRGHVADFHAFDVGHVNHGDVHGDNAHDGRELAAHQDVAAIAERAVDAVAVARGQHADE